MAVSIRVTTPSSAEMTKDTSIDWSKLLLANILEAKSKSKSKTKCIMRYVLFGLWPRVVPDLNVAFLSYCMLQATKVMVWDIAFLGQPFAGCYPVPLKKRVVKSKIRYLVLWLNFCTPSKGLIVMITFLMYTIFVDIYLFGSKRVKIQKNCNLKCLQLYTTTFYYKG